jgi:Ca-activated chloride channel family protein
MKLRTLMLSSALGMAATGALVWSAVQPSTHSSGPRTADPTKPTPPPTPIDHSHFQAGKTLMVEGRLGHAVLPADLDNETFLFVDVTGADVVAKNAAPLDLSIVIDKSGSMAGKRLTNAIAAAKTAIERLRDGDVVSVISFNTAVDVVIHPTAIDATSRGKLVGQLAAIHAGGDTCISCGIDTAMQLLAQRDGMVERVLLLSDGQPTAGVRDVDGFKRIAENCRRMGASVTTIGVDVEYDEKVMSALARSSNGHHFFVADPTGLPTIFDSEMASLTKTVANRAELTVDLAPGVVADRVFDRTTTGSGSQLVVPLGSFSAGDHKTVLMHLRVPRGNAGERPIAAVRLHYDDLADTKPGECEGALATRLSTVTSELTPLDALVSARVTATETAGTLEASNALFRAGKADEARRLIATEQAKLAQVRHQAVNMAPVERRPDVQRSFDKDSEALGDSDGGFAAAGSGATATPSTGVAAAPPPAPAADHRGQAQVRKNQQTAIEVTE